MSEFYGDQIEGAHESYSHMRGSLGRPEVKKYYVHWTAGSRTPICSGPMSLRAARKESDMLLRIGVLAAIDTTPLDQEEARKDEEAYLRSVVIGLGG